VLAVKILQKMGHEVVVVANGALAVAAAANERFDIVLMDCQMPEVDGFEATRRIREHEGVHVTGRRLSIVAITESALTCDREKCIESGMDGYLAKPYRVPELAAVLREWSQVKQPSLPAPAPADAPRVFEVEEALARVGCDRELLAEVAELLLNDAPILLETLKDALGRGDHAAMTNAAHGMKGAVSNIGGAALSATLQRLEAALRGGHPANLDELVALASGQWQALASELVSWRSAA